MKNGIPYAVIVVGDHCGDELANLVAEAIDESLRFTPTADDLLEISAESVMHDAPAYFPKKKKKHLPCGCRQWETCKLCNH